MTSSNISPPQVAFTSDQLAGLITRLQALGLYNSASDTVVIPKDMAASSGLFASIYSYIYSIIQNNPHVSAETKYWFSQAPAINRDDTSTAVDNFIRGTTEYGLLYGGKLSGQSQQAINSGLQRTSNLIGLNVVNSILQAGTKTADGLNSGGIPTFANMLSGDIGAAIGTQAPLDYQQTLGGWANARAN
ncbi:MAG TPA: hypothetical protein VHW71_08015 [Steroidobacteraceae bacterium]|jgi:hypothetical protein|nr:hypothetical protein [Steroidobacteraceae bacterium]